MSTVNWADEVEQAESGRKPLPRGSETFDKGMKIVTEFQYNKENKIEKVVRTFKVERRLVSKSVATRKAWKKFGDCENDKPGPNAASTFVSEDIQIQYISGKDDVDKAEESPFDKLKLEKGLVKCRICGGDHWSIGCPYKNSSTKLKPDEKLEPPSAMAGGGSGGMNDDKGKNPPGRYVPPSLREGAAGKRPDGSYSGVRADVAAIRVSNLPPNTTEKDLEKLIIPFGPIAKLFLAKERNTGVCKGFAYIHYKNKDDAQRAILYLNGYGYDHLILSVDWSNSKPN